MRESGKQILDAVQRLRKMHQDIALLLRTADARLEQDGWVPMAGSVATADTSASLNSPHKWMPRYAFRFVTNPSHPGIFAFISVILDHAEETDLVTEPLISAGWLEYEKEAITSNDYWCARLHLWMPGRKDDGSFIAAESSQEPLSEWNVGFVRASTLAVPLVDITSEEVLDTKVVGPLLQALGTDGAGAGM